MSTVTPRQFGMIPSDPAKVALLEAYEPKLEIPASWGIVPGTLSYWLNDSDGDCHDSATEVLTSEGWVLWPNYDGEAPLGTMNPTTRMLEFQAPLAVKRREHDGSMAFAEHEALDFGVTPNHRMFYAPYVIPNPKKYVRGTAGYGPFRFGTIDRIPTRCLIPGATSGFIGTRLEQLGIGARLWDGTDLIRLLAVIAADGFPRSGAFHRDRVSFCCFREDRREMVASLAHRLGIPETTRRGVWEFSDGALADWLRANLYIGDKYSSLTKRVPELIKVASSDQITEFLTYFGDQDHWAKTSGGRNFYSSSKRMADDIQELLLRIGKRGTLHRRPPREGGYNGKSTRIVSKNDAFVVHEYINGEDLALIRRKAHPGVVFDHYRGEVFCATVPNSTLITRRNGRILISGNCVLASNCFRLAAYSVQMGLPEVVISDGEVQTWGRAHGVLNGADILSEIEQMQTDPILGPDGKPYTMGPPTNVDFTNYASLCSAITEGPVQIGVAGNPLEGVVGGSNGWFAGTLRGGAQNHSVTLCGYGTVTECYALLGMPMPAEATSFANDQGLLLFTWSTIGVITFTALGSIISEAYVCNPTCPEMSPAPPVPPGPGPDPNPNPPPPGPPNPPPAPPPSPPPSPPPVPATPGVTWDENARVVTIPAGWSSGTHLFGQAINVVPSQQWVSVPRGWTAVNASQ